MSALHRILFIGVGSIGERHLRCFLRTGRVEPAICECSAARCHEIAAKYQVGRQFASLEETPIGDFDAALVATPAHLHIPVALKLAEAGVHLLVEKPLSTELDGIDRLTAEVERRELRAAVLYHYRTHPALTAMKAAIDSGRFGRPLQLVSINGQHFPFYRPAYRETYYRDHSTGGGAIQDVLSHSINAAEWLIGPLGCLAADASHQALPGVEVEDTVHVIARHGGTLATYSVNQFQMANEATLTVHCERGSVQFLLAEHRWRWCDSPGTPWRDEPFVSLERDDIYTIQARVLLDMLEGRAAPPCTLADGLQTLRANLAVLEAASRGDRFSSLAR